jgi:subtilisin family serine protease
MTSGSPTVHDPEPRFERSRLSVGQPGTSVPACRPSPSQSRPKDSDSVLGELRSVWKRVLNGFAIRMSREAAEKLSQDDRVESVTQAGRHRGHSTQYNPPWGLDRIDQASLPLSGSYNRWYSANNWASNYGSLLDVFAPGQDIPAADYTGDHDSQCFDATSAAAPHVAGVAALYLESRPWLIAQGVAEAIIDAATTGVVGNPGTGSPNRLLYSGLVGIDVLEPNEYLFENQEATSRDGRFHL